MIALLYPEMEVVFVDDMENMITRREPALDIEVRTVVKELDI